VRALPVLQRRDVRRHLRDWLRRPRRLGDGCAGSPGGWPRAAVARALPLTVGRCRAGHERGGRAKRAAALASQRQLQLNRTVIQYEVPGTHNGAIAQDYEMGIEEDFLSDLLEPIYGAERSVIVIANQRHSLLDQLRMGVRHVEVDVYNYDRLGGFKVCHWPVCPPDFYIIVTRAAERQGLDPLDWQCSNLGTAPAAAARRWVGPTRGRPPRAAPGRAAAGCDERKPFYVDILREVRGWLDQPENANEFVTLYIDNKNIRDEEDCIAFAEATESVLGDLVFRPTHKQTEYPNRSVGPVDRGGARRGDAADGRRRALLPATPSRAPQVAHHRRARGPQPPRPL